MTIAEMGGCSALQASDEDPTGDADISCGDITCGTSTISETCTISGTDEMSCKGVTYKFSGASFSYTVDFAGVNNTSFTSGTFKVTADFSGKVSGGELKEGELKCKMQMTVPLSSNASESDDYVPNCDSGDFSCTFDGDELDCKTLTEMMDADNGC